MGKSAPSPPAAPDPAATAAAQGAINKETAVAQANLNRINQYSPYGSSVYKQVGTNADSTPQYEQTTTFAPEQQQQLDLTNQAGIKTGNIANEQLDRLRTSLAAPINYDSAPELKSTIDVNSPTYKAAEESYLSRVNPQLDHDRSSLEQRLANQGIAVGSEAYTRAQSDFGQQANDARSQAITAAMTKALQDATLGNSARAQSIQETASLRNQPLNEISALLSGSQVQAPQFSQTPQVGVQPADITGPTALNYQGALAQQNAAMQSNNASTGGLFGLGGSAIVGASFFL